MNRALLLPILVLVAAGVAGCSHDMSDLEQYVAKVKARKSNAIPPIPQPVQYQPFQYDPVGRPDPFTPLADESRTPNDGAGSGQRPDPNRNREPLEQYPLDALRMMGTISTPGGIYAMIKAPDGVIHRVTLQNYMGKNYGRIVAITESEVRLTELVPDGFGGWTRRDASLALTE